MTILKARFESKCEVAYPEDEQAADGSGEVELCDGIKVGDEMIYQIMQRSERRDRLNLPGTIYTSVGHLKCRAEEYDRKVLDGIRKMGLDILSKLDENSTTDEKIMDSTFLTPTSMARHMERWTEEQRLRVRPENSNLFKTEKETA